MGGRDSTTPELLLRFFELRDFSVLCPVFTHCVFQAKIKSCAARGLRIVIANLASIWRSMTEVTELNDNAHKAERSFILDP